jgi:hypothetical protein
MVVPLIALACVSCRFHRPVATVTIFGNRAPVDGRSDPDTKPVELGLRFRSAEPGSITGVRFFKTAGNNGLHTGSLWSSSGRRLALGTFQGESDHGWQELTFESPVKLDPNTNYIASYHTDMGHYAAEPGGLATATSNGPLTAPAHSAREANSLYSYGPGAFPTDTWAAANYWVDVRFAPDGSAPSTTSAPTTASTTMTTATTAPGAPATTTTAPPPGNAPGVGITLRPIDGGANYFGRWANSLPTDPSFYPISVFNETLADPASDAARYQALGVNGYVALWNGMTPQIADALKANGQWAFANPGPNGAPGYGREWAGYLWFDEADGNNLCGDMGWLSAYCTGGGSRTPPAAIKAMADAVRAADGTRPTFGQYTKPVALGDGLDDVTRKAYVDPVDVVSYDYYPLTDPYTPGELWDQADAVADVRRLAGRSKPVWVFIETSRLFGQPIGRTKPSPAQVQAEVWHAIIGGAQGIEYFNHDFSGDPGQTQHLLIDPTYSAVSAAVAQTNRQIRALAPVINAPYADGLVTVTSGAVNSMVKYHDGSYYLFVGSRSKSPQTVTMKLASIGNTTATLVNENRTVPVTGGTLTDTFSGETAVHIYKIG